MVPCSVYLMVHDATFQCRPVQGSAAFQQNAVDLLLSQLFHQLQKIHMTAMLFQTKDPATGLLICRLLLWVAAAGRKNGRNLFGGHDHL